MTRDSNEWLWIIGAVIALVIAAHIISFVWFPFLPWLEQREAGEKVVESEMSASDALEEYRWFRQQHHDIEAKRTHIQNLYEEEEQFHETYGDDPSEWSRSAETRHNRIHQRITGNKNQLQNMVAEYNARSDDATAAVFKCNLPYQVDDRFAIEGPPGSGAPDEPNDKYRDEADPNAEPPEPEECDGLPAEAEA
jgi:hypothetical protein